MRLVKKIFLYVSVILLLLVGALVVVGTVYEDKVVEYVKQELGKQLTRPVNVSSMEYSLFSNFPNVSVDLNNIQAYSFEEGDKPFLSLNKIHLVFDVFPLIQGDFQVGKIILEEGQVNVITNKQGEPNYNILKENSDSTKSSSSFSIENVELVNVKLGYEDWKEDQAYNIDLAKCKIEPTSLQDSISLSAEFLGVVPKLKIDDFESQKSISLEGDFGLVITHDKILFEFLGDLENGSTKVNGRIDKKADVEAWDFNFDLDDQRVSNLVALLPNNYKDPIVSSLKGGVSVDVKIKGDKTTKKSPPLQILFSLNNGSFSVDENSFKEVFAKGIYFQSSLNSIKNATVKIDKYSANYNDIKISGSGEVSDFERPFISAEIQSDFDLASLHKLALKEEFKELKGQASFDMSLSGRLKELFVDKKKAELKSLQSEGTLSLSNVVAQPSDFGYPININSGKLSFNKSNLNLESFEGKILSSSFKMNGKIKDYLETVLFEEPLLFESDLKMDQMILEEFIGGETDSISQSNNEYSFELPQSIALETNLELGQFSFRKFKASDISGRMTLRNQVLKFDDLKMKTCDGSAKVKGSINAQNENKVVFRSKTEFKDIDANKAFYQFENFGQDVLLQRHVKGKISINSLLLAESDKQLNLDENKIYTETSLSIQNGELVKFEPLIELQEYLNSEFKLNFNLSHLKFSTLENNIEINNGVINIPEMAIRSSDLNLDLEGTHSFNQDIDYLLKIKHSEIFKANKQNKIDAEFGVVENNDKTATLPLRMTGNIDDPKFSYDIKTKRTLIKETWAKETQEIKKVFKEEFGTIFKGKNKVEEDKKKEEVDLNNGPEKTVTTVSWEDEEEEDEE